MGISHTERMRDAQKRKGISRKEHAMKVISHGKKLNTLIRGTPEGKKMPKNVTRREAAKGARAKY